MKWALNWQILIVSIHGYKRSPKIRGGSPPSTLLRGKFAKDYLGWKVRRELTKEADVHQDYIARESPLRIVKCGSPPRVIWVRDSLSRTIYYWEYLSRMVWSGKVLWDCLVSTSPQRDGCLFISQISSSRLQMKILVSVSSLKKKVYTQAKS